MNDDRHEIEIEIEIKDELGAYLLGALSPEESERVEMLLETSPVAREALRYMRPAVELLAEAVPRREPLPGLRERILADVGADSAAPVGAAGHRRERKTSWFSLRGGFSFQPAVAMAAILIVAVVGVVGYEVGIGGGGNKRQTFTAPGQPQAQLKVDGDNGTLELTGLTKLIPGRDYQAWVQRDGMMVPASLFAVRKDGTATAAIPHQLKGADAVVVTSEPEGGSRVPTGPRITSVSLPK